MFRLPEFSKIKEAAFINHVSLEHVTQMKVLKIHR